MGHAPRALPFVMITVVLLIGLSMAALVLGPADITLGQTIKILLAGPDGALGATYSASQRYIIWNLRLPRVLTATVAGMVLAVAGVVFQALFRNPMADPYVLGISSGAAFGVAFAAFLGLVSGATGAWSVPLAAFSGAIGAAFIIFTLAGGVRRSPVTLLLTGIALNFMLSALMTLFMYLNRSQLQSIIQWTMGSFGTASWNKLLILSLCSLVGIAPLFLMTRELDILLLDEQSGLSVGVPLRTVRFILLMLSTLITAVTVSFCGVIGFVGLMVPHIVRLIIGPRHRQLLLCSMVGGAVMMVGADTLARTVLGASELPVGVITSLAGAPLFIILLVNHHKGARR